MKNNFNLEKTIKNYEKILGFHKCKLIKDYPIFARPELSELDINFSFEYPNHESLIKMFLETEKVPKKDKFNKISSFYHGFCFIINAEMNEKTQEQIFLFLKNNRHKFNDNLFFIINNFEKLQVFIPNLEKEEGVCIPIEKFLSKYFYNEEIINSKDIFKNFSYITQFNIILEVASYLKEFGIKTILFTDIYYDQKDLYNILFYKLGPHSFGIVKCNGNFKFLLETIGEFKRLTVLKFRK